MSIDICRCNVVRDRTLDYDIEKVKDAADAYNVLKKYGLPDFAEEHLVVLLVAADGKINGLHEVSHGGLASSFASPREVFKAAVLCNACSIIVAHNHPSGSMEPSQCDIETTTRLVKAGALMDIPVLDHIIVGDKGFCSMKASGIIQ